MNVPHAVVEGHALERIRWDSGAKMATAECRCGWSESRKTKLAAQHAYTRHKATAAPVKE